MTWQTKKPSEMEGFFVSAGAFEYHPSCGDAQPKQRSLPSGRLLVSAGGFEPSTNGLKGHCSAVELRAHF